MGVTHMDRQDIQDDRVVFIGSCLQLRKSYQDFLILLIL